MMKIYTRGGDTGETGLIGGSRVRKDHLRITACGEIDELNAALGVARAHLTGDDAERRQIDTTLGFLQHRLFTLGAELATPTPAEGSAQQVSKADIARLEGAIDHCENGLQPLTEFILPAGVPAAAQLHLARCVCRRAERAVVTLAAQEPVRGEVLGFVNRISDLLFVLARVVNCAAGVKDDPWDKERGATPSCDEGGCS